MHGISIAYNPRHILQLPRSTRLTPAPELVNLHTAFHQAQYAKVLSFDTTALSPSNALPARILKLRAQIALQHYDDVLSDIAGEEDAVPDLAAAGVLARWSQSQASGSDDGAALDEAARLAARERDNPSVQLLCGTVLAGAGRYDEALGLLGRHQGSLDACVLRFSHARPEWSNSG